MSALYESNLKSLKRIGKGKVRDIYAVDVDKMMILVSDRLSAFDVVLPDPIPDKGRVLTELANFWFAKLGHVVPNHLTGIDPESVVKGEDEKAQVRGRAIVVKKLKPLPVEAVVRGYIIGSGWKDYQATGAVCGIQLPKGLQAGAEAARADLHARHQGRERPRREHFLRARVRNRRQGGRCQNEGHQYPPLQGSLGVRGDQGHHHRRYQI